MSQLSDHASQPSLETLRWVAQAVGAGAAVESVSRLAGATSSVVHGIEVNYKGRSIELVLRQFFNTEWLETEPDLALHEASSLLKAAQADVPTPELIAYDTRGDCCGVPTTLMTRLPGNVNLSPQNLDGWLDGLAEALTHIHALDAEDFGWNYFDYSDITRLAPPRWSKFPKQWERAIEVVAGPRPATRECFIHRDYHPNNVVWQGERLSGVIDWVNSCRGAPGFDVAWCRLNLTKLCGVAEADQFLSAYQSLRGASFEYHPYWDLLAIIEVLPGPPDVYEGWLAFGVSHLTDEIVKTRVDDYLLSLMARV
ncbi:MAG: aminoglycoside phosphotransferase family protein [Acidobacteria bacterium]|nr:aminoglycoside phosphotransferase family protein [Acidobacteriota bacterium]